MPEIGVSGASAWRMMAGVLILVVQPWRSSFARRDLALVVGYGVALGAMNFSFYSAIRTVPIGVAMAIQFTGPLAVAAFSTLRVRELIWPGLAFASLVLLLPVTSLSSPIDPAGAMWACAAAAFWAIYMIIGKATAHLPLGPTVGLGMLAAALVIAPVGLIEAGGRIFSPGVALVGFGIALLSALAYSLEMVALRGLPRRTFGVLINVEPALGAAAAFVAFGEVLDSLQWSAMLAIIIACVGSTVSTRFPATALDPRTLK